MVTSWATALADVAASRVLSACPPPTGLAQPGRLTLRAWHAGQRGHGDAAAIASEDLVGPWRSRMGDPTAPRPEEWEMELLLPGLMAGLEAAAEDFPDLSLRAAMGWLVGAPERWAEDSKGHVRALVAQWATGRPVADGEPTAQEVAAHRDTLTRLAECGWLLAAAGITHAEAAESAETLGWAQVQAVAALRGFPFPRTL